MNTDYRTIVIVSVTIIETYGNKIVAYGSIDSTYGNTMIINGSFNAAYGKTVVTNGSVSEVDVNESVIYIVSLNYNTLLRFQCLVRPHPHPLSKRDGCTNNLISANALSFGDLSRLIREG